MSKQRRDEVIRRTLLAHLSRDVWARIAPSEVHGVGLVAVRNIPPDTVVDKVPAGLMPPSMRKQIPTLALQESDLGELPSGVAQYLREMYVVQQGAMDIGCLGANSFVGLSHFVNHPPEGRTPNAQFVDGADDDLGFNMKLKTTAFVPAGAELFVDYHQYLTPDELAVLPGMEHIGRGEAAAAEATARRRPGEQSA
eukprot:TRINITY_DN50170_c0_g1_i1.p1 TRINITY_DN50170_c0_g1~~TRINITY_DN50170_c0_g1_i1.p1  ORF type:complete len:218 (+),score=54.67 TRINITY_DN50170_c0_g1_i1:67-654(+)